MNIKLTKKQVLEVVENMSKMNDILIDEAYPESFNMDSFKQLKTFAERIRYCEEHLSKIGAGSSRIVYKIDNEKVLKLAKNNKGIAQNEAEYDIFKTAYYADNLAAEVFDVDDHYLWIEMELAEKCKPSTFKQLIGVDINTFGMYIRNEYSDYKRGKKLFRLDQEDLEKLENSDFAIDMVNLVLETDIAPADLGRLSSYGIVKRNGQPEIVLVDYGATEDIISKFY